jgi:hypothetical protein
MEARIRLRAALRRIVDSIWVLTVREKPRETARGFRSKIGSGRFAAVQVWFAEGGKHRDYLIYYRPRMAGAVGTREAVELVASMADVVKLGPLDLRKRDHAKRLEKVLTDLELPELRD